MKKKTTQKEKQDSPEKSPEYLAFEDLARKIITTPKKDLPKDCSKNKPKE